ncbi:MAG: zinc ribbon domain-containing protein [Chloroflexi bacterium]|nr:MAG: zinc ribbon domain-containing protein [Chloroflexota bacterium]
MPIYEYVCKDCGQKYEKFVRSATAEVKLVCPSCGSERGEKALSLFGAVSGSARSGGASTSFSSAPSCGPVG